MAKVREKKRVLIVGDADSFSRQIIDELSNVYDVTVLTKEATPVGAINLILLDSDTALGKSVLQKAGSLPSVPIITISESSVILPAEQANGLDIRHQLNKMWTSLNALLRVVASVLH